MEKLLHWSIEAAKNPETAGEPDAELISKLFSGYDDHTAMKVNLQEAVESKDKQARIEALEVFEELVENVDNANDIGNLWPPLLFLCQDADHDVRQLALSSVAYAVQNNDKAQGDLLSIKEGFKIVMLHCEDDNELTASKALFATAATIGHNRKAYEAFEANDGLEMLDRLVKQLPANGSYSKKHSRTLSLLYAVLNQPSPPNLAAITDKVKTLTPDTHGKLDAILSLIR